MNRRLLRFYLLLLGISAAVPAGAANLEPYRVSVSVQDETGSPVRAGSYYFLTERSKNAPDFREGAQWSSGWANEEGRFEFPVDEPGRITLHVHAPGYLPREVDFDPPQGGGQGRLDVVLKAGPSTLVGQVTGPGGQPLPDILVNATIKNREPGRLLPDISLRETDVNGRFSIIGLTDEIWSVSVRHPGYLPVAKELKLHAGENRLDLRLEHGLEVEGRIVNLAGQPVPAAWPSLEPDPADDPSALGFGGDASDDAGHFLISGVSPGRYRLQIRKQGYLEPASVPVLLTDRSVRGIEIRLDRGGTLHGRVRGLAAKDLAEMRIYPEPDEPINSRGEFRIHGLRPGDWIVTAESGNRTVEAKGTLTEGSGEATFDLEFRPGLLLSGQILRAGKPMSNGMARILSGPPGSLSWKQVFVNTRGEFRFEDLPPGLYRVGIFDLSRGSLLHEQEIELREDRHLQIGLRTGSVSGRVVIADTDSQPVAWAYVTLWRPDVLEGKYPIGAGGTSSDAQGMFTIEDIAVGSYSITVKRSGYQDAVATLQVEEDGTAEIQVAMESTAARWICVPGIPNKKP